MAGDGSERRKAIKSIPSSPSAVLGRRRPCRDRRLAVDAELRGARCFGIVSKIWDMAAHAHRVERTFRCEGMAKLARHQRVVIALPAHILHAGVMLPSKARVDVVEVWLPLRCLVPHCPERWPLDLYWTAARQENEIGGAQGVTAAFNGIVRQLRL